jgi:hypothetical protein
MILMSRRPTGRTESDWLDEHAETWVEHGLVSSDQVEAIRTFERTHTDTRSRADAAPRLSIAAELAVYLGSVVTLMSGAMLAGQRWESLDTGSRAGIGLVVAALGFVAGMRLIQLDDPSSRRLASFMWLIGTGGVALAVGVLVAQAEFEEPGWNVLLVGVPILAIGAALWRNLERPLQVLTTAVGVGLTFGGIGALLSIPPWIGGIMVWSAGLAIGASAVMQRLRPELYVLGVAAVTAMLGALMLTDVSEFMGALAATITAAGVVGIGLVRRLVPILVIGVFAFLQSLQGLLMIVVDGAVAALMVAVAGLVVVIVVIVRSTRPSTRSTP